MHEAAKVIYMKDPENGRADSAARSHESYKKDLEKSCDDSATRAVRVTGRIEVVHETAKVTWRESLVAFVPFGGCTVAAFCVSNST